jgi:hypothetical protein
LVLADLQNKIVKVNDVISVDEEHGLVFGYAIVSKIANAAGELEDYYDLNVDQDGVHKGQRVPEHITESVGTHVPGNDMHAGPDVGSYYFMFPVTTEIAKALGWEVKKTGLVVGYHPGDDAMLAKFKNGTYTGFSIEGERVTAEEIEA